MANSKATKKALFGSVVSLLLCFTMLIGATFAWFTDNVKNTGNKILAGDLEVKLLMHDGSDYQDISENKAPIFGEGAIAQNNHQSTLWEPGKTQIVYLGIQNAGNLALKYNVILDIVDGGLIGSLEYALIDGAMEGDIDSWADAKANATISGDIEAGKLVAAQNGVLDEVVNGTENETNYFALAVHMKEDAGNEYQGKNITLDILVNATQVEAELDSFGSDYDAGAEYADVALKTVKENATEPTDITAGGVNVEIPVAAGAGNYSLEVVKKGATTTAGGETNVDYDITLLKDGVPAPGIPYTVEIQLDPMLNVTDVKHNGVSIPSYNYNITTGLLSFETTGFSPFSVVYTELDEDAPVAKTRVISASEEIENPEGTVVLGKDFAIDTTGSKMGADFGEINLETAYQFQPTLSADEVKLSDYKKWHADFVVSVDKDIPADSIALAGYYDAWCSLNNDKWVALPNADMSIDAGFELRLIDAMGNGSITVSLKDLSDYGNDGIGFLCGAMELNDNLPENTTLTVELRLYEATDGSSDSETGRYMTIGKYNYTFK